MRHKILVGLAANYILSISVADEPGCATEISPFCGACGQIRHRSAAFCGATEDFFQPSTQHTPIAFLVFKKSQKTIKSSKKIL
jgi:hypothetical protein